MRRKREVVASTKNSLQNDERHTMSYYPAVEPRRVLLSKNELIATHPWCNQRITYNYISTCYRAPNDSTISCLLSLFTIHNEVVSAWSHYIGATIAMVCLSITLFSIEDTFPKGILATICLSGFFMFYSSASYHTFCCHSDLVCRRVQCMDWLGIAVHTFSTNLLVSYFELRLFPRCFFWFSVVNVLFALFSYFITYSALQKVYHSSDVQSGKAPAIEHHQTSLPIFWLPLLSIIESYTFRSLIAMFYGLGSIIAWCIGYYLTGIINDHLFWIVNIYGCFGTVVLCLWDIPERWLPPGMVDIVVSYIPSWYNWLYFPFPSH